MKFFSPVAGTPAPNLCFKAASAIHGSWHDLDKQDTGSVYVVGNPRAFGFSGTVPRVSQSDSQIRLDRCLKITSLATRQNNLRLPWELDPEVAALLGNIYCFSAISGCSRSACIPVSCARPKMRRNGNMTKFLLHNYKLLNYCCCIRSTRSTVWIES